VTPSGVDPTKALQIINYVGDGERVYRATGR
jgi:hypothetical protein